MNPRRLALASLALALSAAARAGEPPPGAAPRAADLEARLATALEELGPDYEPRTRHRRKDGSPRWSNRLLLESSPYLRQHAHNPVDWYPWGDAAFEAARHLGRPVLLSIGYSTCHWCHVMEEESFEDPELARLLNERYVAVKVDREERPDVDAVYLGAVQLLSGGHGGWPLTVWLTADRRPFYGTTYLPPEDGARGVRLGFRTLLDRLADVHAEQPDDVARSAARVVEGLEELLDHGTAGAAPDAGLVAAAVDRLAARFDERYGGLVGRQKFPRGVPLRLLLADHARRGTGRALEMAVLTLESIRDGGIRDHVSGGIHRYTTDPRWRVPHFEKMLYDNALLALACLDAARATGRRDFRELARETLDWAEREMSHPDGGFYSATDADSEAPGGERLEGFFFTWTPGELESALGREAAGLVAARYGVDAGGDIGGRSVLHVARSLDELAREGGASREALERALEDSLLKLRRVRSARPRPLRDEKVLAGWNGLMISALSRAAVDLGDPARARRAERAAGFVLDALGPPSRLKRSWSAGGADHRAVLEDHAFLAAGLIDLYQATGRVRWLETAIALDEALADEFEDPERGGFFATARSAEALLVRPRGIFDGALPSGNGVHVQNLARLAVITGDDRYRGRGEAALAGFASALERAPEAAAAALVGLDLLRADPREIAIVVPRDRDEAEAFLVELRRRHLPEAVLLVAVEGADLDAQARAVPLLEGKRCRNGRATAYVCRRGVCRLPTDDPAVFGRLLDGEVD